MYKLIIIDDEDIIRQGIAGSMHWEEFGFELAGQAANGEEAWDLIQEVQPHLIISDIYMPQWDGIELAEQVRKHFPETVIVFLSGYNDFNYARRSIDLGIFCYLTKPVQNKELVNTLVRVKSEIEYKLGEKERLKKVMEQIHESLPLLREKFLKELTTCQMSREELEEGLNFLDMKMAGDRFVCMIAGIDDYFELSGQHKGAKFHLLKFLLVNMLKERLEESFSQSYVFQAEQNEIAVLGCFSHSEVENFNDFIYSLLSNMQLAIKNQLHIGVSFAVGEETEDIINVSEAYLQARAAMEYKVVMGKDSIILFSDIRRVRQNVVFPRIVNENELLAALHSGNSGNAIKNIRNAFTRLKSDKSAKRQHIYLMTAEIINRVMLIAMEKNNRLDEVFGAGFDPYSEMYKYETVEDLVTWIENIIEKGIESVNKGIRASTREFVDRAKKYIDVHFAEDGLNLNSIADAVFISPCYLSQVFNQIMGVSIVEYIANVRIDKAKELLRDKTLKAYEIAFMVGFKDSHYFSSCFKKAVGVSPSDYREYAEFDICL